VVHIKNLLSLRVHARVCCRKFESSFLERTHLSLGTKKSPIQSSVIRSIPLSILFLACVAAVFKAGDRVLGIHKGDAMLYKAIVKKA